MYNNLITIYFIIILLTGCVATGPKFSDVQSSIDNKALIYIYRPFTPPIALSPTILINDIRVAELTNKGFFDIYLNPGVYTIQADWSTLSGVPDGKVQFNAESGKTYFVLVSTTMNLKTMIPTAGALMPIFSSEGSIILVDEDAALNQIKTCNKLSDINSNSIIIRPE